MITYETLGNHSTFGGYINELDFDTECNRTLNMANRIANDIAFDEQCRKNAITRERKIK